LAALRNRRIPIHTVGFGREQPVSDIEIDDAAGASRAPAHSRLAAGIRLHQHGDSGRSSQGGVPDGAKVLAARDIMFDRDGSLQSTSMLFNVGAAGAKALQFSIEPLQGEESTANNAITRLVNVDSDRRRVLYVEGEPRWEYKFVRR